MNEQVHYQRQFFEYAAKRRGRERMLQDVQQVLGIGMGAAYKRMNGQTALTTAELVKLANHFDVSLDTIYQEERYISFQHPFYEQKSSIDLLKNFSFFLKPLGSPGPSQLTYLANELPVFYYFSHRYIFNFLLSVWTHLHWTDSRLVITENKEVTHQIEFIRQEIMRYYEGHPVTEVWNSNMLANLYQQIIFSVTVRAFREEVYIQHLVHDIERLISHLRALAMSDYSGNDVVRAKERKIYLNDYGNYLNMVLYESDKFKTTFVGYDVPQFMVSYNRAFFDFSKNWLQKIKKRSALISSEGYQHREMFFIKLENDFAAFRDRLDKLVAVYYR